MTTSRTILLASDFSARSDRPLDRAIQLARAWNGRLIVAHILENPPAGAATPSLEELRQSLQTDLPETARDAELIIQTGSAPHTIAAIAKERDASIILAGVARYNSWGDYFLGTAVDYIVRHSEAPVLVVRQRAFEPYRRLVVATDFSSCALSALVTAADLFPEIPIILVHAWHVPFEAFLSSQNTRSAVSESETSEMTKFLENTAIAPNIRARITAITDEGEMVQVLHRHMKSPKTDLLVIGSHGQSGFVQATLGSTAAKILNSARGDVLVVRDRRC